MKTTASGLAYQVLKEGNGATPKATDMVQVNYVGKLIDGTVFDESKGTPAEFRVDQVIKGWTEMLQLMKVGEKVKVVIPQELAYGARFAGEKIPPFSTLVFEIELLKVSAASAAQPGLSLSYRCVPALITYLPMWLHTSLEVYQPIWLFVPPYLADNSGISCGDMPCWRP